MCAFRKTLFKKVNGSPCGHAGMFAPEQVPERDNLQLIQ
jgi:hypothetical protein